MTYRSVQNVCKLIEEFKGRVRLLDVQIKENQPGLFQSGESIYTCKEAAALKRVSMDLTRALARMRRAR